MPDDRMLSEECKWGHPLTNDNVKVRFRGIYPWKACKTCDRLRVKRSRQIMRPLTASDRRRFESKYEKSPGCWMWRAARFTTGYGNFTQGKNVPAQRIAWLLYRGEIPPGMCVLHSCDEPACVNPDHLWLGTQADNVADRQRKNRQAIRERNGRWRGGISGRLVKAARLVRGKK